MDTKLYQQLLDTVAVTVSTEDSPCVVKHMLVSPHVCLRPQCGQLVARNQTHHTFYAKPYPHWRSRCDDCLCYLDPYTHEPLKGPKTKTQNTVITRVRQHHRQRVTPAVPEPHPTHTPHVREHQHQDHIEIITETDTGTITRYIYPGDK